MTHARPSPLALREATERLLDGAPLAALQRASERLSAAYRDVAGAAAPWTSRYDRLAYVAERLPATCAATHAVFGELRRHAPELPVNSLLELGAGPAPGLWAARPHFPALQRATHVEIDVDMAELGRRLQAGGGLAAGVQSTSVRLDRTEPVQQAGGGLAAGVQSTWRVQDAVRAHELEGHDLVLVGYVLGELRQGDRDRFVDTAWSLATGALVIVEPGTPAGAARVMRARARLVEHGAAVAAPCPHAGVCPLPADDWCHFGARVNRSSLHRRLKGGRLPYEDEKYAYVVVTRGRADPCAARVLRRPETAPRRVVLPLCTAGGLRRELVTRRDGDRYRTARRTRWGDGWGSNAPASTRADEGA